MVEVAIGSGTLDRLGKDRFVGHQVTVGRAGFDDHRQRRRRSLCAICRCGRDLGSRNASTTSPATPGAAPAASAAFLLVGGFLRSGWGSGRLRCFGMSGGSGWTGILLASPAPAASTARASTAATTATTGLLLLVAHFLCGRGGLLGNGLRPCGKGFVFAVFLRPLILFAFLLLLVPGFFNGLLVRRRNRCFLERRRRGSDFLRRGEQLHLALLDRILSAIHVKNILALIAFVWAGMNRLGTLLLALRGSLVAALLVAPATATAVLITLLVARIAPSIAAIAALPVLLLLLGSGRRRGRRCRDHSQLFQENQAVARVIELQTHRIHAQIRISLDHDPLAPMQLEGGQIGAFFVLEVKADFRTDGQLDAGDALIVGGDGQAAHMTSKAMLSGVLTSPAPLQCGQSK